MIVFFITLEKRFIKFFSIDLNFLLSYHLNRATSYSKIRKEKNMYHGRFKKTHYESGFDFNLNKINT